MKEEKRKSPAVYAFLAFMAALLIANICIRVAIPRVNLYEEGRGSLEAYPRAVYTLPKGTYEVLGSFGSEAGSASHIPFKTWEDITASLFRTVRDSSMLWPQGCRAKSFRRLRPERRSN